MIWATVSSRSCFCWLYRVSSPSAAKANRVLSREHTAKNIINLISVLTIWWCPSVELSLVLLEEGCMLWPVCSLDKTVSLCPASLCTPRPNLPVNLGVSWLPTFAFQSPLMKMTSFFGFSSRRSCRSSWNWKWKWSHSVVSNSLRLHGL